jgi:hypothetical protein
MMDIQGFGKLDIMANYHISIAVFLFQYSQCVLFQELICGAGGSFRSSDGGSKHRSRASINARFLLNRTALAMCLILSHSYIYKDD